MRALVLDGGLHYETQRAQPEPREDQVLLRIRRAGICNTDLELMAGYMQFTGILGHEFVGEVVDSASDLIGRRVVGEINVACGACDFCNRGIPSQCRARTTVGIDRHDGAFADYLALARRNLYVVPDSVTDDQAVFVEPLAAALQILEAVQIEPRDRVVVIGAGKLGMLAAQVLRLTGADLVVVVRHDRQHALLDRWHIPSTTIDRLAPHRAQVVVDCTGRPEGFADALNLVQARGTIVLKSTYHGLPSADLTRVVVDEIRVVGSRCGPFAAALRLLEAGLVDVEGLIDSRYPFAEAERALKHAAERGIFKVLLDF